MSRDFSPEPGTSSAASDVSSNLENVPPEKENYHGKEFNWNTFLDEMGCYASTASFLWKHDTYMKKLVFEVFFVEGKWCFVRKDSTVRPAIIQLTLPMECNVEYQDVPHSDSEWVTFDQLVTDQEEIQKHRREIGAKVTVELDFVDYHLVHQYADCLDLKVYELAKPEMYFEVRDQNDPTLMYIAKLASNSGGIVTYSTFEGQELQTIHLGDARCFPLLWARCHPEEFRYHCFYPPSYLDQVKVFPVPRICFEKVGPTKHAFEVGNLLEMLDDSGLFCYPGHISKIITPYYATADIYTERQLEPEKIIVTKDAAGFYPQHFSLQNKLFLQTPKQMTARGQTFSWINYKNMARNQRGQTVSDSTLRPINQQKVHCMQYVEYFCYKNCVMTPALIVRSRRDSIWLITALNESSAKAAHCYVGDLTIFPVGFAEKHKVPFCATPHLPIVLPPKPEDSEQSRFGLDRYFKSIPPSIFRKPQYSGRGRPEKTWHFMTDWNLRGDNWLPPIHISRECRLGPWLDPRAFATLKNVFPGGNISDLIELIFKEFFRCTKPEYRDEVIETFNATDTKLVMPKQVVKYKYKMEGWTVTLQACESCESFPGWLRCFLQCYQCCPNLLALVADHSCRDECSTVIDLVSTGLYENGRRLPADVPPTKKRARRDPKPTRKPEHNFFGAVGDAAPNRSTRFVGHIDFPEYTYWSKKDLLDYLADHCPNVKLQLKQLENKMVTTSEILACHDAMAITTLGYKPRDAEKVHDALEGLRMAYRKDFTGI